MSSSNLLSSSQVLLLLRGVYFLLLVLAEACRHTYFLSPAISPSQRYMGYLSLILLLAALLSSASGATSIIPG